MASCLVIDCRTGDIKKVEDFLQKFGQKPTHLAKIFYIINQKIPKSDILYFTSMAEVYNHINNKEKDMLFVYNTNVNSLDKIKSYLTKRKHSNSIVKNEEQGKPIDYRIKIVERITIKNKGLIFPFNLISSWFQYSAWRLIMLYKKFRLFVCSDEEQSSVRIVKFSQKHQLLDSKSFIVYDKLNVEYVDRNLKKDITFKNVISMILGKNPSKWTVFKMFLFVWLLCLQSLGVPNAQAYNNSVSVLLLFSIKLATFVSEKNWLRFIFFVPSPFILYSLTHFKPHVFVSMLIILFPKFDLISLFGFIVVVRVINFINNIILFMCKPIKQLFFKKIK
jgi:hypothetical protein